MSEVASSQTIIMESILPKIATQWLEVDSSLRTSGSKEQNIPHYSCLPLGHSPLVSCAPVHPVKKCNSFAQLLRHSSRPSAPRYVKLSGRLAPSYIKTFFTSVSSLPGRSSLRSAASFWLFPACEGIQLNKQLFAYVGP